METRISRQSNDIILKATAEIFKGEALEAIGSEFLPLMRHKEKEGEVALKAAELAKRIKDERQNLVFAGIIALSDKYMTESEKKRLLEVVAMTQIEQWIREEGRKEGRIEGIAIGMEKGERKEALATARAALKEGLPVDMVARITGLSPDEVLKIKKEMEQ